MTRHRNTTAPIKMHMPPAKFLPLGHPIHRFFTLRSFWRMRRNLIAMDRTIVDAAK